MVSLGLPAQHSPWCTAYGLSVVVPAVSSVDKRGRGRGEALNLDLLISHRFLHAQDPCMHKASTSSTAADLCTPRIHAHVKP
eukprot:353578-Chlamydomonas_euryale.AAC.4